jgi:hypothetical protein
VDTTTGGFSLRLNDEIEGQLDVTLHDDTELDGGNAISLVAIERINQFTPAEEDANAAHITLLRLRSGWVGLVNLVYNAEIADSFETAAAEFLDAAEASLAQGLFRPFADSLHSSVELLAQGFIYVHADTQASLAADLPVGTDARRPPTDGSAPTRGSTLASLPCTIESPTSGRQPVTRSEALTSPPTMRQRSSAKREPCSRSFAI